MVHNPAQLAPPLPQPTSLPRSLHSPRISRLTCCNADTLPTLCLLSSASVSPAVVSPILPQRCHPAGTARIWFHMLRGIIPAHSVFVCVVLSRHPERFVRRTPLAFQCRYILQLLDVLNVLSLLYLMLLKILCASTTDAPAPQSPSPRTSTLRSLLHEPQALPALHPKLPSAKAGAATPQTTDRPRARRASLHPPPQAPKSAPTPPTHRAKRRSRPGAPVSVLAPLTYPHGRGSTAQRCLH